MPAGVTHKQLASVGLSSRPTDIYELCPPGFTSLEEVSQKNLSTKKPPGRPRGRPRGSKNKVVSKGQATDDAINSQPSVANTTHRRSSAKTITKCSSLEVKIDRILNLLPDSIENERRRSDTERKHYSMRHSNGKQESSKDGAKITPTCTISRPVTSDEDELPSLDNVLTTNNSRHEGDAAGDGSTLYPSTRSRCVQSDPKKETSFLSQITYRKIPSYEEQSDMESQDEN